MLCLSLLYFLGALAGLAVAWPLRRVSGLGRTTWTWWLGWGLAGGLLAGITAVAVDLALFTWDTFPAWELEPGVGYAGQFEYRLIALLCAAITTASLVLLYAIWGAMRPCPSRDTARVPLGLRWLAVAVLMLMGLVSGHVYGPAGTRSEPYWRRFGFIAEFADGQVVELRRTAKGPISTAALRRIRSATSLESLDLGQEVTDDDLRYLARLPKLRKLDLVSCRRITDAGIEHLRGHPALEELDLTGTAVTDACIPTLLTMPKIKRLSASSSGISVEGDRRFYEELRRRGVDPFK